jgi:hypothetical protein
LQATCGCAAARALVLDRWRVASQQQQVRACGCARSARKLARDDADRHRTFATELQLQKSVVDGEVERNVRVPLRFRVRDVVVISERVREYLANLFMSVDSDRLAS